MAVRQHEERRGPRINGSKPPTAKQRRAKPTPRPGGGGFVLRLLQILGLGILGVLALMLSRGPSGPRRARRRANPEDAPRDLWPDEAVSEASFEAAPDDAISWIAGPTGDLRILERHPQGEITLLLIHGLAGRLEHWLPLLDRTGPALRCLAVDLPGHGESDSRNDGTDITVQQMAQAMRAVLETLGLRRVLVVGHDLGATVALQLASLVPERVLGLFLIDPNGDQSRLDDAAKASVLEAMEKDPKDEVRWQFRQILINVAPQVADRVLADIDTSQSSALLGAVRSSLGFEPAVALEAYGGPCQVLISPLNDLPYSLHKVVPNLAWSMLPGASHWMMMDTPQGVWEGLVDFLDRRVMIDDG